MAKKNRVTNRFLPGMILLSGTFVSLESTENVAKVIMLIPMARL